MIFYLLLAFSSATTSAQDPNGTRAIVDQPQSELDPDMTDDDVADNDATDNDAADNDAADNDAADNDEGAEQKEVEPRLEISRALTFAAWGAMIGTSFTAGITLWIIYASQIPLSRQAGEMNFVMIAVFAAFFLTLAAMGSLVWATNDVVDALFGTAFAFAATSLAVTGASAVGAALLGTVSIGYAGYVVLNWQSVVEATSLDIAVFSVLVIPFAFMAGGTLGLYAAMFVSPILVGAVAGFIGSLGMRTTSDLISDLFRRNIDDDKERNAENDNGPMME